jgi:ubiquinone/menaquinone biosynthesis C-methylase UbiE
MNNREGDRAREHNRRAWDRLAEKKHRFTRPAKNEDLVDPLATVDAVGWLGGDIRGLNLLCLAAGGGKHSVIYATAGANVTVVDISPAMLEMDRQVAAEKELDIRTVEGSMDDLGMFGEADFDLVIHPVSTCYLPSIAPVYQAVARVLRVGGLYISQHKQPVSLQSDQHPSAAGYEISEPYYRQAALPKVVGSLLREEGTLEYLHRWEELLGDLCRCGFVIEDLTEPVHARQDAEHGSFGHRASYIAPYVRIKARRLNADYLQPTPRVILPG